MWRAPWQESGQRVSRRKPLISLAVCWCFGLGLGCAAGWSGGDSFISWMRTADFSGVSIVSLFLSLFLPFLFSAFAVSIQQNWIIFSLAFVKCFSFGFCAAGVVRCFGRGGWLICSMLLFSDLVVLPWCALFFGRCLGDVKRFGKWECACFAALVFLVVTIDRCFITPFLASLL